MLMMVFNAGSIKAPLDVLGFPLGPLHSFLIWINSQRGSVPYSSPTNLHREAITPTAEGIAGEVAHFPS